MRSRYTAVATFVVLALAVPGLGGDGALSMRVAAATTLGSFSGAEAGSWTATASMSTARGSMTATRLGNGRVLVVGGADVLTAELYDPPTGTWLPAGTLGEPRGLHVAVRLADGRVLVAGGGRYSARAELYDPATTGGRRPGA